MAEVAQQPTNAPRPFKDPSKAKAAAVLSHEARRQNKLIATVAELLASTSPEQLKQLFPSLPAIPAQLPIALEQDKIAENPNEYTSASLPRVRAHLERLNKLLEAETDPAKLDRLAAAFGKLSEIERQLAGRPLPGSLRPGVDKRPGGLFTRPAPTAASSPAGPAAPSKFEQE